MNDAELKDLSAQVKRLTARVEDPFHREKIGE